jgi:hypothetical protein
VSTLVLRSLVVYGLTAAALLYAAHRWILPLKVWMALLLALAPLLFTGPATLRGEVYAPLDILYGSEPFASHRAQVGVSSVRTPLLSDVVYSMIPWQKAVREAAKNGRLPLWNRFVLAGEPLLAVQQPAALHPLTWIGFLLPLAQAWTFQMSARLLLALLSAYLLFRDLGCREAASLLGALGWGFSDFMMFWLGYPVANSFGPFPLLLLGLSRLARDADRRALALTAAALILIITAGHPESLLFAVSGAGVYFLFLLGFAPSGRRVRPLLLSLAAGGIALGLTAVQLAPMVEALPKTWEHVFRSDYYAHVKKSAEALESLRRAAISVLPFAYGVSGHGSARDGFGVPGGYAGAILLPLAAAGLLSRDRRRWAFLTLGVLGLAVGARARFVTDALTSLPLFDITVTDYFVFLAAFAVCGLAALGTDRLLAGEGRRLFLGSAAVCTLAVAMLYLLREPGMRRLDMPISYLHRRVLLEIAPLAIAAAFVAVNPLRRRILGGALVVLLASGRLLEAGGIYPACKASALAPPLPVLDAIPRGEPVRMLALGLTFVPNASALYELEDVRGYESMTLGTLVATYPLWCTAQGPWFNRVDDLEKPFLSFLNVGFALVPPDYPPPPGWTLRSRDRSGDLLQNARCLPRAFAPDWIRFEPDMARRLDLMASISDFGSQGVIGSEIGTAAGSFRRNGAATVVIESYAAQSIALAVDAHEASVVATSIPAWPGWIATLDGRPIPALDYNNAFLGFRVPRGAHRLLLRYRPASVTLGGALSALTLAGLAVALLVRRRGISRAQPVEGSAFGPG